MPDFNAKMHQNRFRLGLRPKPRWGAYNAPPDPLAGFKGLTSRGGEGSEGLGWEVGTGEGGEGREGEGVTNMIRHRNPLLTIIQP